MILCIFSVQIWTTGPYNPFGDLAAFIIIPATYLLCKIVHELCMIIGDLLGIWKVKNDVAVEQTRQEEAVPLAAIFDALSGPAKEPRANPRPEMAFTKEQWRRVEAEQKQIDLAKPNLLTDRMIAQTYREMFLELNSPLPAETVCRYLTKSLRHDNREEIIAQFTELYGVAKPRNIERRESEDSLIKKRTLPIPDNNIELTQPAKQIMKDWLERAKLRRRLRTQVAKFIEQKRDTMCEKCKGSVWLKAECGDEMLDLFDAFVKEENQDAGSYNVLMWRRYFRKHATIYTNCIDCRVPPLSERSEDLLKRWLSAARERLGASQCLSLIHICRCRRLLTCRSRWSPYH
eukprot:TRINITY_DN18892_c0_g2_i1.p1 TRINITY_DN18892_c0_g2~~TRINITY_DN18892_c0_g2_i1.p1  ORF type:complete len:346 (+),score=55.10 TRINITY_DN18892_c0_g2_i1:84-1121(+)